MDGNLLKMKIVEAGFELVEVARLLDISPQNLQSKLNSRDIKVGFLKEIAKCINKDLYYFLDIQKVGVKVDDTKEKEDTIPKSKYLEVIIESQKSDLRNKDMVINALQEALAQAKSRLKEHGLTS